MNYSISKLIIIFLLLTSFGCNQKEDVISIKKTIKSLNNSPISVTIMITQKNDTIKKCRESNSESNHVNDS